MKITSKGNAYDYDTSDTTRADRRNRKREGGRGRRKTDAFLDSPLLSRLIVTPISARKNNATLETRCTRVMR